MGFVISQDQFSGPLAVLLELLEKNELEIKDIHLAKIADEYLGYLESAEVATEEMADYLVIASRLIYLKSRELMPYLRLDEEEEEVANLEDQLRLYKMFSDAADRIQERFASQQYAFARPFVRRKKQVVEQVEYRHPENVDVNAIHHAFQLLMKRLAPFFALQQASIERVKSVEERLDELRGAVMTRAKMTFKEVVTGAKSKSEVVVSFLALLELVRRQFVRVHQASDNTIHIERV